MDISGLSRATKLQGREPVWIHPDDAAARDIADRDIVRLFNERGACLAGAIVGDDVRPGVVRMQTGAWYDPLEPGKTGSLDRHGNPNILTQDRGTSKLGQGPIAESVLVEVERWNGELPEITVGRKPDITQR